MKFKIGDTNNQPKDPIKEIEDRLINQYGFNFFSESECWNNIEKDIQALMALVKEYEKYVGDKDLAQQIKSRIFGSSEGE